MAATVSAWSKPGAWALDSEENEAELLQQDPEHVSNTATKPASAALSDFPSLAAAAATNKSKKKSKGQTVSLQEFYTGKHGASQDAAPSKGLTHDELLFLPTGPRQRSAEELDRNKLGNGFRSYGSSYDRPSRGSSDEQPRRQRDSSREFVPSRADETDDWGAAKKSTTANGFERRDRGPRGVGFSSNSQSRADEVNDWVSSKTFVPSEGKRYGRRGGFESNGGSDSDNWVKRKEEDGRRFGPSGGAFDSLRERRGSSESMNGGGLDSDSWGRKREEGSGGRPRLNLQPRTLPVGNGHQNNESLVKPKGSSPFGSARPREEVLKEKGQDWKEIEEKLESSKIKDAAVPDVPPIAKKAFGTGNWRESSPEGRTEKTWRKPEPADAHPPSADKAEDGYAEEVADADAHEQM